MVPGLGFRVTGLGFRVQGLGFKVQGLGVQGSGRSAPNFWGVGLRVSRWQGWGA